MRTLRCIHQIYVLALALLGCTKNETPGGNSSGGSEVDRPNRAQVFLIITTESCPCTLEECRDLETYLNDTIKGRSIPIQKIDYARDWSRANSLLNTHDLQFVPAVILLDAKGIVVFREDGHVDITALRHALKQVIP